MRDTEEKPDQDKYTGLDLTRRQLVRIFNLNRWDLGGRFYGGWWQTIPRSYRRFLTINGKPTTEVDFSGMHVHLLYAQVGVDYNGDVYNIGMPSVPREITKVAFQKLLNTDSGKRAEPLFKGRIYGPTWSELLDAIRRTHQPIAQFFGEGYGRRLQNTDAQIANCVMLRMAEMSYPCLPVHDSFIVHRDLASDLKMIMLEEFHRHTGRAGTTKATVGFMDDQQYHPTEPQIVNIDGTELFSSRSPYKGYEDRLQTWYESQSLLADNKGREG